MAKTAAQPMSVEQFLDWNWGGDQVYELVEGEPVAMAPPRPGHQILAANLARRLSEVLDDRPPCTVRVEAAVMAGEATCYIADLAVTCVPHEPDQRTTPEPLVVVEILSPSTETHDRRIKLPDYRGLPSVQEIVLIDSRQSYCEVHRRLDEDRWLTDLLRGPESTLRLESLGFEQPLGVLYANVMLEVG